MNLRQIEVFRAIMLTGSFTAAAALLHVSQPGISRSARHLELQLGVSLFEHKRGRIKPTPEAHALHGEIERSYRGVQAIQQFAAGLKSGTRIILRTVCSPNVGLKLVPSALAELAVSQSFAALSLEVLPRAEQMIDALVTEQADLGITAVALDHALLESQAVGSWNLVCAFPKGHLLEAKRALRLRDLLDHPLVSFHTDTLQGRITSDWFAKLDATPKASVQVRSGHSACALVASGAGIAIVDNITARAFASDGLVFRAIPDSPVFTAYAVWNINRPLSQLAKRFIAGVEQQFKSVEASAARTAAAKASRPTAS